MQEEVEKQACNLVVTVAKLTVQELMKKLNEYVAEKKADKAAIRRAKMLEPKHGKQSVKELIGQGQGVQSIDIEKAGLKCQTAHCGRRKPHFDFGGNTSPIVPYRHLPQTLRGLTADCRSLV